MNEPLFYVGVTHRTAPLAIRENLRPDSEKQRAMLARLPALAHGRLVLATCERLEIYATTKRRDDAAWASCLADWFHLPCEVLLRHAQTKHSADAAEHLLRVAAGLESRILGEPQILGQVRDAYLVASGTGSLDASLSALGRAAIRVGKRVRHETEINRGDRSIATIAVDRLEQRLGALADRTVVIAGSGTLALDIAARLGQRETGQVIVVARNADRARTVAAQAHGKALGLECLSAALAQADAVVACTAAPTFLIDRSTLVPRGLAASARNHEHNSPPSQGGLQGSGVQCAGASRSVQDGGLVIIDLAVPRNVDPAVARVSGVRLVHLDELVPTESAQPRGVAAAHEIVAEELHRFLRWQRERSVAPAVARMMKRMSGVRGGQEPDKQALHARIIAMKQEAA